MKLWAYYNYFSFTGKKFPRLINCYSYYNILVIFNALVNSHYLKLLGMYEIGQYVIVI